MLLDYNVSFLEDGYAHIYSILSCLNTIYELYIMNRKIIIYDKSVRFWKEAPTTSIINTLINLNPFSKTTDPTLIQTSVLSSDYTIDYEKYLYREKYGDEYYTLKKLESSKSVEYSAFIYDYFYENNLRIKKKYQSFYISENIKHTILYGVELRVDKTQKLIGILLVKNLGTINFGSHKASLVTELCIHPSYRKQGFPNLLLRRLYCYSIRMGIYIHFFQIDLVYLYPMIPILSMRNVYGRKRNASPNIKDIDLRKSGLTDEIKIKLKQHYYKETTRPIVALDNPSFDIIVYTSKNGIIVLRDLYELDHNKYGAEVLYAESYKNNLGDIDSMLDLTEFEWFESNVAYSSLWKQKGRTSTFGFHLQYGRPAMRNFYYV